MAVIKNVLLDEIADNSVENLESGERSSNSQCDNHDDIIENKTDIRMIRLSKAKIKRSTYSHLQQHDDLCHLEEESSTSNVHNTSSFSNNTITKENDNNESEVADYDIPYLEDWCSNCCFLLGSILFVWLAFWDIDYDWNHRNEDYDDDSDDLVDELTHHNVIVFVWHLVSSSPYVSVTASAALFYVFDCIFQLWKFVRLHRISQHKKQAVATHDVDALANRSNVELSIVSLTITQSDNHQEEDRIECAIPDSHVLDRSHCHAVPSSYHSTRATKRSYCLQVLAVLTFGGGALSELVGALLVDSNDVVSDMMFMIGVHLYLVNALLVLSPILRRALQESVTICSPRQLICRNRCYDSSFIEQVGDFLFLTGSIIDVILSYWDLELQSKLLVDGLNLLSAVLWFIDAICFLAADYMALRNSARIIIPVADKNDDSE